MRYKNMAVRNCAFMLAIVAITLAVSVTGCTAVTNSSGTAGESLSIPLKGKTTGATSGSVIACAGTDCSVYLTRAETRKLNDNVNLEGGGVVGLGVSCGLFTLMSGPAGVIVAVACGAGIAIYGGVLLNVIAHAASDNGCLRIKFRAIRVHVPFTHITKYVPFAPGLGFDDDHSGYCH